jgi:hypothetical protein
MVSFVLPSVRSREGSREREFEREYLEHSITV